MSMPIFPPIDPSLTTEKAINMILHSIALEERALSHIINAEGEKIQAAIGLVQNQCPYPDMKIILDVNKSVKAVIEQVKEMQMLLKSKMSLAIEYLPEPENPKEGDCSLMTNIPCKPIICQKPLVPPIMADPSTQDCPINSNDLNFQTNSDASINISYQSNSDSSIITDNYSQSEVAESIIIPESYSSLISEEQTANNFQTEATHFKIFKTDWITNQYLGLSRNTFNDADIKLQRNNQGNTIIILNSPNKYIFDFNIEVQQKNYGIEPISVEFLIFENNNVQKNINFTQMCKSAYTLLNGAFIYNGAGYISVKIYSKNEIKENGGTLRVTKEKSI